MPEPSPAKPSPVKPDLGFAGVGRMGARMARRLVDAGFELFVFDTNATALQPLLAAGARQVDSPAALASAAEIVLVSLPTPSIVHAVALGPEGIIEGSRVRIFVDTSTT